MDRLHKSQISHRTEGFLRRLANDRAGNTLALIAAAIFPMLGMIGGGIDMGRAYLAESRLQAACDAGVLAARKQLGTEAAVTGDIPPSVALIGTRFFNLNFRNGTYGTENRDFAMTLQGDFAVAGTATVDVPTSIMRVFGFQNVPIRVDCEAEISVSNLDVMMVLDVTGSMRHTNPDDSLSRIESLKSVIRRFHAQLETAKNAGSRVRYGFVPYASNVNVGGLLEDDWVTNQWTYQSRIDDGVNQTVRTRAFTRNWETISGTWNRVVHSTYAATFYPATPGTPGTGDTEGTPATAETYKCEGTTPTSDYTVTENTVETITEQVTDPDGERVIQYRERIDNGTNYSTSRSGETCTVYAGVHDNFERFYEYVTEPYYSNSQQWTYQPVSSDVTDWRTGSIGCIEERATYKINDYDNVDLTQALDLDLDSIPTPGDPNTQWRPQYPEKIYARSFNTAGSGSFSVAPVTTTTNYADTGNWWFSACPAEAQKLTEMDSDALDAYLTTLAPFGATYHDIGMIWGGRLMSSTGLFAAENADVAGVSTGRHMIFLTDGQTEAYDMAYSSYGIEGLDLRRWDPSDPITLAETVEARFSVACEEVKKRNISVWVIAFGTYLNQSMLDCAGEGRYFEASSADDLNNAFSSIARSIGDLRVSN